MGATVSGQARLRELRTEFQATLPQMTPKRLCERINSLAKGILGSTDATCCECSVILAWLLREEKGLDACVRICEYCTCLKGEECDCDPEPHFYVSCEGQILDPTRDQFDAGPLACSVRGRSAENYLSCPDGEVGEPPVRPTCGNVLVTLRHPCVHSSPRQIDALCLVVGLKE